MAYITFQPVSSPVQAKGGSGTIESDGTFKLTTIEHGDGAYIGEYRVTFSILDSYPLGKSIVPPIYTDFRKTPLTATVAADGENHFAFVIKRP